MRRWCMSLWWLCAHSGLAAANTLCVPTVDFPTVQAAIDSAASGDTLLLAPRVFAENPIVVDKDLVIRSRSGGRAILDAAKYAGLNGNTGSALRSIRSQLVIEDIVLRNGKPVNVGAGVWVWGGHVDVRRCRLENNAWGILVFEPRPGSTTIEDCEFVGNGVGLWTFLATEVRRCRFENNWLAVRILGQVDMSDVEVTGSGTPWTWAEAPFAPASLLLPGAWGRLERVRVHDNAMGEGLAGIWLEQGPAEMVACESSNNVSTIGPAGIAAVRVTSLLLRHCTLRGNTSRGPAFPVGGLFADRSQVRAEGCHFEANDSGDRGSAVSAIRDARVELVGCSLVANKARTAGGGIYASAAHVGLDSVLVAGNSAEGGGGIAVDPGGSVTMQRSTLVGNTAAGAGALYVIEGTVTIETSVVAFNVGSPVLVCAGALSRHCTDVYGNSDDASCGLDLGDNLAVDPEFCDFAPARGAYDVRLAATSPLAETPECGRIGAAAVGCTASAVRRLTWSAAKALFR